VGSSRVLTYYSYAPRDVPAHAAKFLAPRGLAGVTIGAAMKLYSYLSGPDDDSFCHRVTERLNRGWELYGSPALTYDSETKRVICGQAVVKEVNGEYSREVDLAKL
jgi:hypothetical protein